MLPVRLEPSTTLPLSHCAPRMNRFSTINRLLHENGVDLSQMACFYIVLKATYRAWLDKDKKPIMYEMGLGTRESGVVVCDQQRRIQGCASAQSVWRFCNSLPGKSNKLTYYIQYFIMLHVASLRS